MNNYSSLFKDYMKGFSFASNFIYNTTAQDLVQTNVFSYRICPGLSTDLLLNFTGGDVEVATRINKQIMSNLSVEGYLSWLYNTQSFDIFKLSMFYKPNASTTTELEYVNPILTRKDPRHQTFFLTQGVWTFRYLVQANQYNRFGFDYTTNFDNQVSALSVGIENTQIENTTLKAKLNKVGELEVASRFNWDANMSIIASTKFNLTSFKTESESDFGIGVEYTF
jgi:hypothetical protein